MVTAYRASSHAHRAGEMLARSRGITVATTVDAACAGAVWPFRVYRVDVDPANVWGADGETLRVAACRFEVEIPEDGVLGPRAAEVRAILERIPSAPWCRPTIREPTEAWMSARIEAYTRAYVECTGPRSVSFADVRNLLDLKMAPDNLLSIDFERPVLYRPNLFALIEDRPQRHHARRAAGLAAANAMVAGIWDPLWTALYVFAELEPGEVGPRDLPLVREALTAARTPAREGARDFVLALASGEGAALQAIADAKLPAVMAFAPIVGRRSRRGDALEVQAMTALIAVWSCAWMTAVRLAATANACVQLLVNDYRGPNPWAPLLDLWLAGGVPVGEVDDLIVVYWCCAFE